MRNFYLQIVFLMMLSSVSLAEIRLWKDNTGKYTIIAKMVAVEGGNVSLRKSDGSVVSVPLARLSAEDQAYAKTQALEEPAAAAPVDDRSEPGDALLPGPLGYFRHVSTAEDGSSKTIIGIVLTLTAESLHPTEEEFQVLLKEAREAPGDSKHLPKSRNHVLVFDPRNFCLKHTDGSEDACETFILPASKKPDGYLSHPVTVTMTQVEPTPADTMFSFCVAASLEGDSPGKRPVSFTFRNSTVRIPNKSISPNDIPEPPAALKPVEIPQIYVPTIPQIHIPNLGF